MSRAPLAPIGFLVTWQRIDLTGLEQLLDPGLTRRRRLDVVGVVADVPPVEDGVLRGADVDEGGLHSRAARSAPGPGRCCRRSGWSRRPAATRSARSGSGPRGPRSGSLRAGRGRPSGSGRRPAPPLATAPDGPRPCGSLDRRPPGIGRPRAPRPSPACGRPGRVRPRPCGHRRPSDGRRRDPPWLPWFPGRPWPPGRRDAGPGCRARSPGRHRPAPAGESPILGRDPAGSGSGRWPSAPGASSGPSVPPVSASRLAAGGVDRRRPRRPTRCRRPSAAAPAPRAASVARPGALPPGGPVGCLRPTTVLLADGWSAFGSARCCIDRLPGRRF